MDPWLGGAIGGFAWGFILGVAATIRSALRLYRLLCKAWGA